MADRLRHRLGRWLLGEPRPEPVPGPVDVTGLPCALALGFDALVRHNTMDLLDLLTGEFADDLDEYAEAARPVERFAPENLRTEELLDQLTARLATRVRLTPSQALRVAEQMRVLAEARVPAPRAAGGAA